MPESDATNNCASSHMLLTKPDSCSILTRNSIRWQRQTQHIVHRASWKNPRERRGRWWQRQPLGTNPESP